MEDGATGLMAYIVGLASPDEIKELERRGWEVEDAPTYFGSPTGSGTSKKNDDDRYIMVFVDNDLFNIMDGPDWEKADGS